MTTTTLSPFQDKLARLDAALTGKLWPTVAHRAAQIAATPEGLLFGSDHAYYLSDGGYSRLIFNLDAEDKPRLFLTSVSRPEVFRRWPGCHAEINAVLAELEAYVRSLSS